MSKLSINEKLKWYQTYYSNQLEIWSAVLLDRGRHDQNQLNQAEEKFFYYSQELDDVRTLITMRLK